MALAWAQIKSGDRSGARASLDHATVAASALETEPQCYGRVRIAQARGEVGDRQGGLALLAQVRIDVEPLGGRRPWVLKDIAMAQSELGDREAARATVRALDLAILSQEGRWNTNLSAVAEAQLAVGDVEEAFRTCTPNGSGESGKRDLAQRIKDQSWMLAKLASAAADDNSQSRHGGDPARLMTPVERATRLAIVRRAIAVAERCPGPTKIAFHGRKHWVSLAHLTRPWRSPAGSTRKGFAIPDRSTRSGPSGVSA